MKKHLINKCICFLLCTLLFLTSCSRKEPNSTVERSILPESLQALDYKEHLDISIGYWNIDGMVKASEPDGMTQYIEDLFNISVHPVSVTWSNYKERYQILSATDSLPDVFATLTLSSNDNNDSAAFTEMIETGSIRPLPQNLSAFPSVKKLLDSVSYTQHTDGQYYAIPRFSFTDSILGATDAAMLVRRDWMNRLNLKNPENFADFASLVEAFAKSDPDGNGIDDTIGYNVNNLSALGKWVILGIAPECNVYSWVEENNRYVPSWSTDNFRNVVSAYRTLYESGGLDPQFYSKSPNTVMEDFASGRLGALEYKSSPASIRELNGLWNTLNDKPMEECVDILPIFPAPDGVRYSNSSSVFWSESYISSAADDAKTERILALFEFLLSEKGQEMCRYGIEGVDYQRLDNGEFQCLLDTNGKNLTAVLMEKYPSFTLFSNIATWGGNWKDFEENELNYLRYGEVSTKLALKSAIWFQDHTTQVTRPYAFLMFPKEPCNQFSTSQAFETFINCIIGSEDAIEMWDQALHTMKEEGLDEYIERQNQHYAQRAQ